MVLSYRDRVFCPISIPLRICDCRAKCIFRIRVDRCCPNLRRRFSRCSRCRCRARIYCCEMSRWRPNRWQKWIYPSRDVCFLDMFRCMCYHFAYKQMKEKRLMVKFEIRNAKMRNQNSKISFLRVQNHTHHLLLPYPCLLSSTQVPQKYAVGNATVVSSS